MRDTIDMAREAWAKAGEGWVDQHWFGDREKAFKEFEALVRADEREEFQRWFVGVITQHEQLILAEREACAALADKLEWADNKGVASAIRARGNT